MKLRRRTFILGTGLLAAAPALANLLPRSAVAQSSSQPVLRIDGWDARDNAPAVSADDEMWISVNRSWRAVWR